MLLAALAALTDLDWRCTLVGPLDLDPDFVDELHKVAADTGIADRVVFAGAAARTTRCGRRTPARTCWCCPRAASPTGWS